MGKMQDVPTTPATAPTTSLAASGTCKTHRQRMRADVFR